VEKGSSNGELGIAWIPPKDKGKQGTLTVHCAEESFSDRVDIIRFSVRRAFVEKVVERWPAVDASDLERNLDALAANEAQRTNQPGAESAAHDPAELLAKMPEPVRAEARILLDSPNLMERVIQDIGALGVAGEKELAATMYLVGTSRLLPEPLAAIVQGPTASGKSYVIRKVASLFPAEAVIVATQLTPQSLFYMQPGSLVHRFIVAGERSRAGDDEAAQATRALREMLSDGRLSKLLPIKKDGQLETVLIQQDGPIAYIESTTLTKIFAEDANRCLLLTTDERPEQTRLILSTLATAYAHGAADRQHIIDRHHALQRTLQPHVVLVPYAGRLADAMGNYRVEARRAYPQVVSMIQASALLHQRQRQVDNGGRLLASADDYRLTRHLLGLPMARQLGGRISEPAARFLERLRSWFGPEEIFTTRDAKGKESRSKSAVYGWLAELHEASMMDKVEAQRGNKAAQWRLSANAPDPDAAAVLPPVENVCS
jgi:hypothetical protein